MNKQEFLKELENKLIKGQFSRREILKAKFLLSCQKGKELNYA